MGLRIGYGIDFHQLVTGRDLFIGGVKIPHDKGALGHSDADVLLHAICDALLGAACLGDIGVHFPDTSQEFKNIDSKILLAKTFELIKKKDILSSISIPHFAWRRQDQTLCSADAGSDRRYPVCFCKRYFHQSHYH
jgi:2-C-methyl-D-erythritol 2,4-cyclodiphosphate synthase